MRPVAAKEAFAWLRVGQKVSAGRGGARRRCRIGNSIVGKEIRSGSVEYATRSPTARGPTGGRRRARRPAGAPRGPSGPWSPRWGRCPQGPIGGPGGTNAHAEGPRAGAGCRGDAQWSRCTAAGRRRAPGPAGPRVEGKLRAPAWAAGEARVRRWGRIWSITDGWVRNATMRIAPWQVGQRMPVGARAVRLQAGDDAHREFALAG